MNDLERRFWSKVDICSDPSVCWPWRGTTGANGYGRLFVGKRFCIASRIAYTLIHGDPGNLFVCHSCDNPPCCNPFHLWAGTQAENIADMWAKNRANRAEPREFGARLTSGQIEAIRADTRPLKVIAKDYGVPPAALRLVLKTLSRSEEVA